MSTQKDQLRDQIKQRLAQMSEKDRAAESRSVCRRIVQSLDSFYFTKGKEVSICAYFPMATEVDIRPAIADLLEREIPVFLPLSENQKLAFRRITTLDGLEKGSFGVPESSSSSELLSESGNVVVLIPGRAFDRSGGRCGRGNGGYDHWIAEYRKRTPDVLCWGICYECQLVHEVPLEPHDERMQNIITARGSMSCGESV